MKKIISGLLILGFLLMIGAVVFYFFFMPGFQSSLQQEQVGKISEGSKIKDTIRVAGDNYLGYWFITSRELKVRLGQKGYALNWSNDGGNYAERQQKFNEGKYDLMVLPVNSYLFHGKPNYQGLIVAALSDSKGADNIVGYQDKISGGAQTKINDLNNPALKIGVTADSPSSFLLNTAIARFDLNKLKTKGQWFVEVNSSEDAYKMLEKHQVDAAILWEPNVSQALQIPGVVSVFGSDQIANMIIDVFVASNDVLLKKSEMVSSAVGPDLPRLSL